MPKVYLGYLASILFCFVFMLCVNITFLSHFGSKWNKKEVVVELIEENQRLHVQLDLQEVDLFELKRDVAEILPEVLNKKSSYKVRQLASISPGSNNHILKSGISKIHLRMAKQYFKNKQYEKFDKKIKSFIKKYPNSVAIPESYLMLAESEYRQLNFIQSMEYINLMVHLFPENELTAHGLFVLGEIMEKYDRLLDAADIYRTVIQAFNVPELKTKSEKKLKDIGLN